MIKEGSTKKSKREIKTAFIGLSHLGLVTSICWASKKISVIAIDQDERLIKALNSQTINSIEPGLNLLLKKSKKYFRATNDFKEVTQADLIFISLDTPIDKPNSLRALKDLIDNSLPYLKQNSILVLMSQVPIGFTRKLYDQILQKRPELEFELFYFLNTLIIGESVKRFLNPERIVIGSVNTSSKLPTLFEQKIKNFHCPIIIMSYESAEMTKSAVNLFLASSIQAANTLADFCEVTGANINEIIPALKLDKRIGPFAYLKPTLRISGGHLERELLKFRYLGKKYCIRSIADFILEENSKRYKWIEEKLKRIIPVNHIKKTICIWGLSYKKDSESTKNAPSLFVIKTLSKKYYINCYDPKAIMPKNLKEFTRFDDKYKALKDSECLIILTDWDEFKKVNLKKVKKLLKKPKIVDIPGILNENLPKDIEYFSLGLSSSQQNLNDSN